jgi:hypothetical protein
VITHRLGRVAAAMILSIAATGGTLALAGSASAAGLPPPHCTLDHGLEWAPLNDPTTVTAYDVLICPPGAGQGEEYPVSVSREVSGQWVVVASGTGAAVYDCKGSNEYTYEGGGDEATLACG